MIHKAKLCGINTQTCVLSLSQRPATILPHARLCLYSASFSRRTSFQIYSAFCSIFLFLCFASWSSSLSRSIHVARWRRWCADCGGKCCSCRRRR
ncbi:hypothetical protein HN51_005679 [Arachis hypogaea]